MCVDRGVDPDPGQTDHTDVQKGLCDEWSLCVSAIVFIISTAEHTLN